MSLKRTITAVAVDSARDYFKERLEQIKQLDLDKDGRKDVEQLSELLTHVGEKVKIAVESTDFQKLATGLEQVIAGATLVGASVDHEKLGGALKEVTTGLRQVGKLLKLGIAEIKEQEKK
jgi:hypothetical protein